MTDIMFEIPSNPNIEKCIITKETVQDGKPPIVILREKEQGKVAKKRRVEVKNNDESA